MTEFRLIQGDCLDRLKELEDCSIDSVVTDPPYFLGFMSKSWDMVDKSSPVYKWHEEWAKEALRVLKPGGHLLAFGGTRTYHHLTLGLENVGFEIRDTIQWIYGSGFPKSHDISKGLEKKGFKEEAKQWSGFGTALKPSHEPIVLARKPLPKGTIVDCVLEHGTGSLNLDGCRVGIETRENGPASTKTVQTMGRPEHSGSGWRDDHKPTKVVGRFPANLVFSHHSDCQLKGSKEVKVLGSPKPEGKRGSEIDFKGKSHEGYGKGGKETVEDWDCHEACPIKALDSQSGLLKKSGKLTPENNIEASQGGASRFFKTFEPDYDESFIYSRKASKKDRGIDNHHPTVKSTKLMAYLCRLITPPGGLILDPFTGSGSTGVAALREGFSFVGIEAEQVYLDIAEKRLSLQWSLADGFFGGEYGTLNKKVEMRNIDKVRLDPKNARKHSKAILIIAVL